MLSSKRWWINQLGLPIALQRHYNEITTRSIDLHKRYRLTEQVAAATRPMPGGTRTSPENHSVSKRQSRQQNGERCSGIVLHLSSMICSAGARMVRWYPVYRRQVGHSEE